MKIVIAPDSYKESLSAIAVAQAIEQGFREIFPYAEYIKIPVADGGEGTVDAMISATGGQKIMTDVTGPLGNKIQAFWGLSGDRKSAFIEMAAASGLELVPPELRNPLNTTSYGTGELIRAALQTGVRHIIIGIGGSATNDGGAGMVQALGAKLRNAYGAEIDFGGGSLHNIASIDVSQLDPRLKDCRIEVACDVTNPLTGEQGASAIFGPQKGATAAIIVILDNNLVHYAQMVKQYLGIDVDRIPGAGAAGGMGAALLAFCGAELRQGVEIVAEALDLETYIKDCHFVLTGEGRIDSQSINGKVPVGVARLAKKYNKPVIGIAGSLATDANIVHQHGVDAIFSIIYHICTLDDALSQATENIRTASRNIASVINIGIASFDIKASA
ncbi:glycerate kinase [Yersinia sp. 2466 StPb PI]|uniref:glycerate kinase n=1 Tax=Yersinia sp. 2466 StPb PI TaxID=3061648 RepID=UPI00355C640D